MKNLLTILALVAVVCGGGFLVLSNRSSPESARRGGPSPSPTASPAAPSSPPVSPDSGAAAMPDARAFLAGYLPYLYSRADLAAVVHLTAEVRQALPSTREAISARQQARPVALTDVAVRFLEGNSTAAVTAIVSEGDPATGVATYPIRFAMTRQTDGWDVASLPTLG